MRDLDVVNLHWCNNFLSPRGIDQIIQRGLPVVWSLHDMWPFTGGCHYTAGCEKFAQDCASCPQLRRDIYGMPAAILRDKAASFQDGRITIVALSEWMKREAERSSLFANSRVELIPNGLDTSIYAADVRAGAKAALGIDENSIALMFGAAHGRSKRKGFDLLAQSIERLAKTRAGKEHDLVVISMGHASADLQKLPVRVVDVGYKESDADIAQVYGAADIFVLPSREDNLPNTVMEAMACGCVPVAFDVGGVGDLFEAGKHGYLIQPFDTNAMSDALNTLLTDAQKRQAMGVACSEWIASRFTLSIQAQRYESLFSELAQGDDEPFRAGLRERMSVRLDPYPSEAFAGTDGALYRRMLFDHYAKKVGGVEEIPTKTLSFLVLRRLVRKISELKVVGPILDGGRKLITRSSAYQKLRSRVADDIGAHD